MTNRRPAHRSIQRLPLLCLLIGSAIAFLHAPAPAQSERLDIDHFNSLVETADKLRWCYAYSLATPLFDSVVNLSPRIVNQEVHNQALAKAALFYFETGNTPRANPLLTTLREVPNISADNRTLSLAHMVLARSAMAGRNRWAAANEIAAAIDKAERSADPILEGRAHMIRAEFLLGQESPTEAMESARKAQEAFTRSENLLALSHSHVMAARCETALGNLRAAAHENQQSVAIISDLDRAPEIDVEKIARQVDALENGHIAAYRQGNVKRAANMILSLILVKEYQAKLRDRELINNTMPLRNSELLAHLAFYHLHDNDPLSAYAFYLLSEKAGADTLSHTARARHRWLMARFLRAAGDPAQALELIDRAQTAIERLALDDPQLTIGLAEEKGLALLQLNRRDEAIEALREATAAAQAAARQDDRQRIHAYMQAIEQGHTDILAAPAQTARQPLASQPDDQMPSDTPAILRSPFVAAYPPESRVSAAQEVEAIPLGRLRPTPTPFDLSPELLIRSGLHSQAAAKLEESIQRQGDSIADLNLLARCYFEMRQWDKARDAYQRLLAIDPQNAPAQEYLRIVNRQIESQSPGTTAQ